MGQPSLPRTVKLFIAITFSDENNLQPVESVLAERLGDIDVKSEIFDFTFTDYYVAEMGAQLKKQLWSYKPLIHPMELVNIKLWTNDIETQFSITNKRTVNLDPGYLSGGNIVLATTKNFSHRLYLDKGIYGDMHFRRVKGKFVANEWTYPDYQQELVICFFERMRTIYLKTEPSTEYEKHNNL